MLILEIVLSAVVLFSTSGAVWPWKDTVHTIGSFLSEDLVAFRHQQPQSSRTLFQSPVQTFAAPCGVQSRARNKHLPLLSTTFTVSHDLNSQRASQSRELQQVCFDDGASRLIGGFPHCSLGVSCELHQIALFCRRCRMNKQVTRKFVHVPAAPRLREDAVPRA